MDIVRRQNQMLPSKSLDQGSKIGNKSGQAVLHLLGQMKDVLLRFGLWSVAQHDGLDEPSGKFF